MNEPSLDRLAGIVDELSAVRGVRTLDLSWAALSEELWETARVVVQDTPPNRVDRADNVLTECDRATRGITWLDIGHPKVRAHIQATVSLLLRAANLSLRSRHGLARHDPGGLESGPMRSAVAWMLDTDKTLLTSSIPVLLVAPHGPAAGEGDLPATLVMEIVADGRNEVYPDPRRVPGCVEDDFAEAVETAREAVSEWWPDHPAMRWRLDPWGLDRAVAPLMLVGTSLGAAFAVNMISLCRRMPARSPSAITASVGSDGRLVAVRDIDRKIAAAQLAEIPNLIVAEWQDVPADRVPAGLSIYHMSDVWRAAHLVASPYRQENHPPSGERLRDSTLAEVESRIYLIANGRRHYIPTPDVLERLSFENPGLPDVSHGCAAKDVEVFPSGPGLMEDGFIVTDTTGAVYILEDGHKRRIEDRQIMRERGYTATRPITMPTHFVDAWPDGEALRAGTDEVNLELAVHSGGKPATQFPGGAPAQVLLTTDADGYIGVPYLRETTTDGVASYYTMDDREPSMAVRKVPRKTPLRIQANGEPARRPLGRRAWVACTFIVGSDGPGTQRLEAWFEDVNGAIPPGHATEPCPIGDAIAETCYTVTGNAADASEQAPGARLLRRGRQTHLSPPTSLLPAAHPGAAHRRYVYRGLDLSDATPALQYLPDGLILKGEGPPVYLYQDGVRRPFRSGEAFEARGYTYCGDWKDWTYLDLPDAIVDGLDVGRHVEDFTVTVGLRLSIGQPGAPHGRLTAGDMVAMRLHVRGDGYTAYVHVTATPPGGVRKYAAVVRGEVVFRDEKTSFDLLPDGQWNRRNVADGEWELHSWTIAEDDPVGEWTWEAWLEDVNVLPGLEDAMETRPVPISDSVARASYELVARP